MAICSICLDTITDNSIILKCNHVYHKECLKECIRHKIKSIEFNKIECPNCREEIKETKDEDINNMIKELNAKVINQLIYSPTYGIGPYIPPIYNSIFYYRTLHRRVNIFTNRISNILINDYTEYRYRYEINREYYTRPYRYEINREYHTRPYRYEINREYHIRPYRYEINREYQRIEYEIPSIIMNINNIRRNTRNDYKKFMKKFKESITYNHNITQNKKYKKYIKNTMYKQSKYPKIR